MAEELKVRITADAKGLAQGAQEASKAVAGLDGRIRDANGRFIKGGAQAAKATRELTDGVDAAKKATEGLGDSGSDSFREYQQGAERAASATRRIGTEARRLNSVGSLIERGAPRALNQFTGLVAGGGILLAAKQSMDFNAQLTQLALNAKDAKGQLNGKDFSVGMTDLHDQIMAVTAATGKAPEELLAGMNAIVERTGDLQLATSTLGLMGKVSLATGAEVSDVGGLISNLSEKAKVGGDAMKSMLEILLSQGKTGAFTMKELSTEGERLFSVFPQFGKLGEEGLRSFGAFVQMAKKGGNAAEASTSIASLAAELSDVSLLSQKMKKAGIGGVQLFNKNGTKRSTEDIVKDIVVAAKGNADKISMVFGESARKTVLQLANEYAAGNGFAMFEKFKGAEGKGVIDADSAAMLATAAGQMGLLTAQVRLFSDEVLSAPLGKLTEFLVYVNSHGEATKLVFQGIALALATLAGTVAMIKGREFVGWMKESLSAGKGTTVGVDGKQQKFAMGGVQQVFVTNMPSGGMGGGGSPLDGGPSPSSTPSGSPSTPAKPKGRFGRFLESVGSKLSPLGKTKVGGLAKSAGTKALQFGKWGFKSNMFTNAGITALDLLTNDGPIDGRSIAGAVGGLAGGAVGMIGGLGAASLPLGIAGNIAGSKGGEALYDSFFGQEKSNSQNNYNPAWTPAVGQDAPVIYAQDNSELTSALQDFSKSNQPINLTLNVSSRDGRIVEQSVSGPGAQRVKMITAPFAMGAY